MTPNNRPIEAWAVANNFSTPFETAVFFDYEGYKLSIGFIPSTNRYGISTPIQRKISKKTIKSLQKSLEDIGTVQLSFSDKVLQLIITPSAIREFSTHTNLAILSFVNALSSENIPPANSCVHCGLPNANIGVEQDVGIIMPIHSACSKKINQSLPVQKPADLGAEGQFALSSTPSLSEESHSSPQRIPPVSKDASSSVVTTLPAPLLKSNYLLGAVGAILGALLGSLPIFIFIYFFKFTFVLYFLIPIGAAVGYRLLGKGVNNYSKVLIVVVSLLFMVFSYLLSLYLSYYIEDYKGYRLAHQVNTGDISVIAAQNKNSNISSFLEYYPDLISLMELEGIGSKLNLINYLRVNPLSRAYSFSFKEYLSFYSNANWFSSHIPKIVATTLFTVLGLVLAILHIGAVKKRQRLPIGAQSSSKPSFSDSVKKTSRGKSPPPSPMESMTQLEDDDPFELSTKSGLPSAPEGIQPTNLAQDFSSAAQSVKDTAPTATFSAGSSSQLGEFETPLTDQLFGDTVKHLGSSTPISTDFETLFADILPKKGDRPKDETKG